MPNAKREFAALRRQMRAASEDHPDPMVRAHAKRVWDAMEGASTDPDNAPAHVRKAIDLALRRYERAVADYKSHKAGKGD